MTVTQGHVLKLKRYLFNCQNLVRCEMRTAAYSATCWAAAAVAATVLAVVAQSVVFGSS